MTPRRLNRQQVFSEIETVRSAKESGGRNPGSTENEVKTMTAVTELLAKRQVHFEVLPHEEAHTRSRKLFRWGSNGGGHRQTDGTRLSRSSGGPVPEGDLHADREGTHRSGRPAPSLSKTMRSCPVRASNPGTSRTRTGGLVRAPEQSQTGGANSASHDQGDLPHLIDVP